jgi:hypothetical protein
MLRRLFNKITGRDKRLRRAVIEARLNAIRERAQIDRTYAEEHIRVMNRKLAEAQAIPVEFFDPYRREFDPAPRPIEPEPFIGGGGQSGGAGASAEWERAESDRPAPAYDPPVADVCQPSYDSSPSCDTSSPSPSE